MVLCDVLACQILMVTKTISARTLKDFVSYAKANSHVLNFSSAGTRVIMRMTGEAFKVEAGVHVMHIPYRILELVRVLRPRQSTQTHSDHAEAGTQHNAQVIGSGR